LLKYLVIPAALLCATSVHADEGQWQPYQLPQLKSELKRVGIAIPAEKLADLSRHPMSAIVSLGGCSARSCRTPAWWSPITTARMAPSSAIRP
jgi:hypothetical protein